MNESLDQRIRHRNAVARAHSQAISGQTTRLMIKESPAYTGRARELLPIVLVNIVLTFLTVGIYRFWAKTRMRRYFVSRVSFLGDPLEYSGTGMELFKGFLIVLAILVPLSIGTGIAQQFLTQPGTDPMSLVIFQVGYLTVFFFLFNFAVYRAQRYRLSRISWRGIRGGQTGSAALYACYAMGVGILTIVTLGLFYPVMRRVLIGYRISRACFGATACTIKGGMLPLFLAWLVPWLAMVSIWGLMVYAAQDVNWFELQTQQNPHIWGAVFGPVWDKYKYPFVALIVLSQLSSLWYSAFEIRQWFRRTRFDQLTFASRLTVFHLALPYLAYLAVMAIAVAAAVWGGWHLVKAPMAIPGLPEGSTVMITLVAFLALWLVGGVLHPLIIQNWLISNICGTLTIQGSFSPDTLFQNQLAIPRRGEGLADALDVDAF